MSTKSEEVSVFKAKPQLSELSRETEAGPFFVIRRRGQAVARLTPTVQKTRVPEIHDSGLLASFREIHARLTMTWKATASDALGAGLCLYTCIGIPRSNIQANGTISNHLNHEATLAFDA